MQYSTWQCSTLKYNTVQYSAVQCSIVQYSTVQYSVVQYSRVQYSTTQCFTIQYSAVQCNTVQYSTVKCRTVQYSTVHIYTQTVQRTTQSTPWLFSYLMWCGVECVLRTRCSVLCVFVVVCFTLSTVKNAKAVLILIPSKRSVCAQYCQMYTISEHHEPVPATATWGHLKTLS